MTPQEIVEKWSRANLSERSACQQQHFLDMCDLLNQPKPAATGLDLAHKKLDDAVFAAYEWSPDISDDELLAKLLALNLERAAAER